jgi:hypothetical protein
MSEAVLRALYRKVGEAGIAQVQAEYRRHYPSGQPRLDQILFSVWKEGRELAGQTYDYGRQTWLDPDGKPID